MDHRSNSGHLQEIDLRKLAELQEAERCCLSVYVSSQEHLNQLEQRAEHVRDLLSDSPDELTYFERNLALVRRWLDESGFADGFSGAGLAVFACEMLDYIDGVHLAVAPETGARQDIMRVGGSFYLRPLAELQDEFEDFLVVAADNRSTRIIQVASANVETADHVRGDVANQVKKGGWSQKRYQRRREKELHHYAQEINDHLRDLVEAHGIERIVLLGSQETLVELEEVLDAQLAAYVVGRQAADLQQGPDALVEEAYELFFAEEREEEEALWRRIQGEYLSDGLATTGATRVLDALKLGRVEEVLVTRNAEIQGTRCHDCENVHGTPQTCQICGSKEVFQLDLVDEMVRLAELSSAHVEFSDEIEGLTGVGEVAALLRY
ncbi:MAG: Vms1/Ankzf1 family peptidyl-tRNA hydrolase [Candidatus Promineifilaceae bacterium]|nr:Vms1/Ankzf1 family peptidyl-tRNA hydrolase [Candidatus Promineifilaceae bacterium]